MNIRAERIDNMIQLLNRNLLLISFDQIDDIANLTFTNLQKIDTGIFGHDKFAFDMVHYVQSSKKSALKSVIDSKSIVKQWESTFVSGLEALLVECAIVRDEIERDCFVSRVYRWFTEKLSEKKNLPKSSTFGSIVT